MAVDKEKKRISNAKYYASPKGRLAHAKYYANNPEKYILRAMIERCHNPDHMNYAEYGGVGIAVCDRWRCSEYGLDNFIADMGYKHHPDNEYHRLNSDQGYNKKNIVQIRRKLHKEIHGAAIWIYYNGILDTYSGWSRRLGGRNLVSRRVTQLGWSELKAVSTPKKKYNSQKKGSQSCSKVTQTEVLNQLNPDGSGLILVKSIVSAAPRMPRGNACLSSTIMTQRELW
jgi:hypothetical protein